MNQEEQATYIGMDLGAFKTSVASSNGHREVVQTAVAQPTDLVARTMLGNDPVFGAEAMKHSHAVSVVRPFAKGVMKYGDTGEGTVSSEQYDAYLAAARLIVEHVVSLTRPAAGLPIYGVIGCPSRASTENKRFILEASREMFEAVFVVPEPFTVAYGMNSLNDSLVIDVGGGTIDICPMLGRFPTETDQVTIQLGGDLIDEVLQLKITEQEPFAEVSLTMAREIKERHGFVEKTEDPAIVTLPTKTRPEEFDLTKVLEDACSTILGPIMDGVHSVFAQLPPQHKQSVLQNVILAGGGGQLKGLDRAIERRLHELGGGQVVRAYDCVFAGAAGALKLALAMEPADWARLSEAERRAA